MNSDAFCQDLDKVNWNMNELDVNQYGTNFLRVFNQILDTHAPLIKTKNSKNQAKRNALPWISKCILKLIKTRDKTYQTFIKEDNISVNPI